MVRRRKRSWPSSLSRCPRLDPVPETFSQQFYHWTPRESSPRNMGVPSSRYTTRVHIYLSIYLYYIHLSLYETIIYIAVAPTAFKCLSDIRFCFPGRRSHDDGDDKFDFLAAASACDSTPTHCSSQTRPFFIFFCSVVVFLCPRPPSPKRPEKTWIVFTHNSKK